MPRADIRRLALAVGMLLLALPVPPASAGGGSPGEFVVRCRYSHTLPDDPIVFPGAPGTSHLHDFFGNTTTTAGSTQESMLAGPTTCRAPSDTAGYWSPVGYLNGRQLKPRLMRIYYFGVPGISVETVPSGLQMIGGNKLATSAVENPHVSWSCGETRTIATPRLDHPYSCAPWSGYRFVDGIVGIVDMPNCWDGTGLAPEDVAYDENDVCPPGFSHHLANISERTHFGIMNPLDPTGALALSLSSGPYYTLHADFWNTWQQPRLDDLVETCLDVHRHCGSVAAAPELDWTLEFGTEAVDSATSVAADATGVYVAGSVGSALPGQTYRRYTDAFIRRYTAGGRELWTRQFGTPGSDQALAVAVDLSGVYVAGSTDGAFHHQTNAGGVDAFVSKYDVKGNALWTRQFGTTGSDQALAIAVDSSGVYVAGSTDGALALRTGGGATDAFVTRFDALGKQGWARQFGTIGSDEALAIAVGRGGVYVAGSTDGALPGQTPSGGTDAYVRRLSAQGREVWTTQFGSAATDIVRAVTATWSGTYVAGSTDGALPGEISSGSLDTFVRKLDPSGGELWAHQFGSSGIDQASAIVAQAPGVYVVGQVEGALTGQTSSGSSDVFARKYDAEGEEIWTRQFGTPDQDLAWGAAVDQTGVYVCGASSGAFSDQTNLGEGDAFVTKIQFT